MAEARESRRRGSHQLPAGRHGLSASFVATNQRERMMAALAEAVARKGYAGLTVEDIIAGAGVSRRTFYDHFANKHDAFLAAFDEVGARLLTAIQESFDEKMPFVERVERCLAAFLGTLANEPAFAHMCIVDALGAGPAAIDRRNAVIGAFAALFDENSGDLAHPPPPLTSRVVVGGIHEIVYEEIRNGRAAELPRLLPQLLYLSLLPFVGAEAAEHAAAAATPPPLAPPPDEPVTVRRRGG